jgi:carbon-monoxide dehydrogenase large subunit
MDYAIPRADEMPHIELESLAASTSANLLGAKGVGEAGCIGVPAALLNAAADALSPLGEKTLDFPLTAERLWRAMQAPHGDLTP